MNPQLLVKHKLDSFVEKVMGVNKPYRALLKSPEHTKFQAAFVAGIRAQAKWASDNMHTILELSHPMQPFNDVQKDRAAGYVRQNMPSIATLVDTEAITDYLKFAFEYGAKAQYQRWFTAKASDSAKFTLTNPKYIKALNDRANYLLNQSTIDDTTREQLISAISDGKQNALTNEEIAGEISDSFDDISNWRANMITRTEAANAMGDADMATMEENGIAKFDWVAAGDKPCPICEENEDGSPYALDDSPDFPAHPNCECYRQADADSIDLDSMSIWDGE